MTDSMGINGIPKDAREVYCNEKGEPIAYCPKESIGITDLERAHFYGLNRERLEQLAARARDKTRESGVRYGVVCIDVDDRTWTPLVDILMPGHDWDAYRRRNEKPVARGVVPQELLVKTVESIYPAAGKFPSDKVSICVFAAGGIAIMSSESGR
jgi:hypothetical protein